MILAALDGNVIEVRFKSKALTERMITFKEVRVRAFHQVMATYYQDLP